mmetsp:Transcript_69424/g.151107  ORF Transcript_69424/g.151107 Transcript_69424/m.151107 type:complete len:303 (-) Transcript_69424:594-1502(-)
MTLSRARSYCGCFAQKDSSRSSVTSSFRFGLNPAIGLLPTGPSKSSSEEEASIMLNGFTSCTDVDASPRGAAGAGLGPPMPTRGAAVAQPPWPGTPATSEFPEASAAGRVAGPGAGDAWRHGPVADGPATPVPGPGPYAIEEEMLAAERSSADPWRGRSMRGPGCPGPSIAEALAPEKSAMALPPGCIGLGPSAGSKPWPIMDEALIPWSSEAAAAGRMGGPCACAMSTPLTLESSMCDPCARRPEACPISCATVPLLPNASSPKPPVPMPAPLSWAPSGPDIRLPQQPSIPAPDGASPGRR